MTYIRSLCWDGVWIAGGVWIGVVLALLTIFLPASPVWLPWGPFGNPHWALALVGRNPIEVALVAFFALAIMMDTAHNMSPIFLVWTDKPLREVALRRPWQYIAMPLCVFAIAAAVGVCVALGWTSYRAGFGQMYQITDWTNPFPILVWTYLSWEIYHFGSQNFGVVSIYRRKLGRSGRRYIDKTLCICITGAVMIISLLPQIRSAILGIFPQWQSLPSPPMIPLWVGFLIFGVISAMHWLVAIGLTSLVSRRSWWMWVGSLLVVGTVGFVWKAATPHGDVLRAVPVILSLRFGLGLVHFIYDRKLWRFSDPQMLVIVGPALGLTQQIGDGRRLAYRGRPINTKTEGPSG